MLADCLAGIRVLDLSQYVPGPYATLLMSDLGAEVVKVEPPAGDPMRGLPPLGADGVAPAYHGLNRNKTVVRLDLKSEDGKAVLRDLVAAADVLLESYRPGVLERLGFGPEDLRRLNPGLVHCALSGFGQTGPLRLRAGHDCTYMALAGALAVTGTADLPIAPFPPIADHASAMNAVIATLAALVRRGRTGRGAALDLSIYESGLALQYQSLLTAATAPIAHERDLLNGAAAYYRVYRCADGGFMALGAIEPKFWRDFCVQVGREDWIARQDEPFPQTALTAEVADLIASRSRQEWTDAFVEVDCCFEPVLTPAEAATHPQAAARGMVTLLPTGDAEPLFPAHADGQPPAARRPLVEAEATAVRDAWTARRD
ncbi:CaiB/BaiF CoA transferase family protein [Caenispirillum bisanense]|uniref:Crotonobetainyl-CoA:carnitine CoA-transferase CaiB n=1 Tax=Caenispirillum bisanense TaxID=414052 RepID=A0A286GQW3_9PROT|nr:CoA transferase [Caenispirillum bisanense]SOD97923.1 Crotonobetainyl-CoA:carnitine CoA-transferase CaiB [Caenispirillum bisanense]